MEKQVIFNNILQFTAEKEINVLTLIAMVRLKGLLHLIEQVFFALIVKNNKVDPNYADIYTS